MNWIGRSKRYVYSINYKKKKRSVLPGLNEDGFTFVHSLVQFQLYLFLSISAMMLLFLTVKIKPFDQLQHFSKMEWQLTMNQIDEELKKAVTVRAINHGHALEVVTHKGQIITFERYKNMIRKRVDSTGHLPLLQKVDELKVITNQQTTVLRVKDESGQIHQASFLTYKGVNRRN
ncbi:competence type IV pilus minor pilin ComGF [Bacillus sp. NPDC077027]|uniref:competence type IV pilus minor pilin ComGF n=1 Tax=Bacillus sp. NPDC077027 TaxID=3390548 RepID=UPI003CFE4BCC